jgi:signal transduction histidine kinase/ligand-binding sensor domain-containing protein
MLCKRTFLLVAYFFFIDYCLQAQQLPFVHYTPKDGLISNAVRSAYQDSKGRIYFITFGGLSVYDGARFTNYTTEDGLATEIVNDIIEMGDDSLWIAVNSAKVNCLVKGKISVLRTADNFLPLVNKFLKTSTGELYALGDYGLYVFKNNSFVQVPLVNKEGKDVSSYLSSALEIDGLLMIQTDLFLHKPQGAIYVYDPALKKIVSEEYNSTVLFATFSPENDIWLTTKQGIRLLDKTALLQKKIFRLLPVPSKYEHISGILTNFLFFDKSGTLWLKWKSDLSKTENDGKTTLITTGNGLAFPNIHSVYEDREGILWFCTQDEGVEKLVTTNIEHFTSLGNRRITDVSPNRAGDSVWMYDDLNQQVLLFSNNTKTTYPVNKGNIEVKNILPQNNGVWLIGLEKTGWFRLVNKKVFTGKYTYSDNKSANYYITRPIIDPYDNIIVSGPQLTVLSGNKKIFTLPFNFLIDQIATDSHNRLWIVSRSNKLIVCSINPGNPAKYLEVIKEFDKELPTNSPRSLSIDRDDNVWIGTRFEGLYYLRLNDLQIISWRKFSVGTGLTENFIHYLYCDKDNTIWSCSPGGLDNIRLENGKFHTYNITKSNNIYQYTHKIFEDNTGVKWVLTSTGIIKIHPRHYSSPSPVPALLITELTAENESIPDYRNKKEFDFFHNDLGFKVAAPSFYDEKQIQYSYLLKGKSNSLWSEPSNNATINFINLQPGNYQLLIKASFPDAKYPDQVISYSFMILPPWWQTWWFKILVAFLTLGLLVGIIRSYFKSKLEKQKKAAEKQQDIAKERTRIALDMHDDLGAGLSTIRFLSEKVRRNTFSDITRADVEKMAHTSNELVENMNEIIWAMNEKNDTLEDLLFYTRSYAKEYCEEHQLNCIVYFPENIAPVSVSGELRRNVFLTVKEALHNIVKHAGATAVEIQILLDNNLTVSIKDNGGGFLQINKDNAGGGNGLKNMKKRIESIGGNFVSQNGFGVTIKIEVPLQKV